MDGSGAQPIEEMVAKLKAEVKGLSRERRDALNKNTAQLLEYLERAGIDTADRVQMRAVLMGTLLLTSATKATEGAPSDGSVSAGVLVSTQLAVAYGCPA